MANNVLKEELILDSKNFDKNINNVIRKVEELKHKGKNVGGGFDASMGKMIQQATGFKFSMGSLVGVVGKFGGAIGAVTAGASLADWFSNAVSEGTKLAEQAEGIRLAFERLNRGDLLKKLREETHGTVNDIELMKQAVKFNDFNLNLDEMGKFLAFAQMKAKDTGESIDYMVDSIVTGLGRKSLPILDNLGLSATKIKEYMKDGGDMTTAVAKIIEEKMKEAGDYVETASDRAKKQEAELQNALEELGQTFLPLKEEAGGFFHEIEIGAINAINSLRPLINQFTELGRIMNNYNKIGGDKKVNTMIDIMDKYSHGDQMRAKAFYDAQLKEFDKYRQELKMRITAFKFNGGGKDAIERGQIQKLEEQIKAVDKQEAEFKRRANEWRNNLMKKPEEEEPTSTTTTGKPIKPPKLRSHVPEYKKEAETVQEIEDNITVLNKQLKDTKPNSEEYKRISAEIKKWKDLLDTTPKPTFIENATVIKDINSNISILQDKLDNTVRGSEEWLKITKQIEEETKKLRDYQDGSLSDLQNQVSEIEEKLSKENLTLEARIELIDKKAELQNKIDNISDDSYIKVTPVEGDKKRKFNSIKNAQSNVNSILDYYDNGLMTYDEAQSEIAKINELLQKIEAKPIVVHLETDTEKLFADIEKGANSFMSAFNGIDSVVGNITSLAQAINEGANAWDIFMSALQTGVGIIETVSTVLNSLNTLQELFGTTSLVAAEQNAAAGASEVATAQGVAAAKSGEAIAGATASGAKMPFPYNLVAIATGVAAVLAALATIAFANGGIVGGSQYAGDALLARVNSGEMILNGSQQKNLFNLLDKGGTNNLTSGNVNFVIRGNDLHGVLRNYDSKMKKVR